MEKPRPLPTHLGFIVLLSLALYGLVVVFLYHLPRRDIPIHEFFKLNGTIVSVRHEPRNVRESQPDSFLTVRAEDGKLHELLVTDGVGLMRKEWAQTQVGDQVSIAYEPRRQANLPPELLAMRSEHFYIDREMLDARIRANDQRTYRNGLIALAISLPWMLTWGWLRRRRARRMENA